VTASWPGPQSTASAPPGAGEDDVVALVAEHGVADEVAAAGREAVVAGPAADRVRAALVRDPVVAAAGRDLVAPGRADQPVGPVGARARPAGARDGLLGLGQRRPAASSSTAATASRARVVARVMPFPPDAALHAARLSPTGGGGRPRTATAAPTAAPVALPFPG
jgi:hypothetical protein